MSSARPFRTMATGEGYPVAPGVIVLVDRARRILADGRPLTRVHVPSAKRLLVRGAAAVNPARLRSPLVREAYERGEPVLTLDVAGIRVVFDGWHRLALAARRGRTWYPALHLEAHEAERCATRELWTRRLPGR